MTGRPPVEVACAVIQRPGGWFLLARRPEGKPYAGYWEFPGGKVEPGESAGHALRRELAEELGIAVERADPWLTREFSYPHARVRLNFFRVGRWHGEPHPHENQQLAWQQTEAVTVEPLLPANAPILQALALPQAYAITQLGEGGAQDFMPRLEAALEGGVRLIQVREKQLPEATLQDFAARVVRAAHARGARVLVNGSASVAQAAGADGVHLSAARLMSLSARPPLALCGASCHDRAELEHAARLGVDFAVLGPVKPTASHPDAVPLGWEGFAALASNLPMPVFAIGGLSAGDIDEASRHGAHGVAMVRAAWPATAAEAALRSS